MVSYNIKFDLFGQINWSTMNKWDIALISIWIIIIFKSFYFSQNLLSFYSLFFHLRWPVGISSRRLFTNSEWTRFIILSSQLSGEKAVVKTKNLLLIRKKKAKKDVEVHHLRVEVHLEGIPFELPCYLGHSKSWKFWLILFFTVLRAVRQNLQAVQVVLAVHLVDLARVLVQRHPPPAPLAILPQQLAREPRESTANYLNKIMYVASAKF